MANKKRKTESAVRDEMRKSDAPEDSASYRSSTTGRYVSRSADRDPTIRARGIRARFRESRRSFSDSVEIVREDRDAG